MGNLKLGFLVVVSLLDLNHYYAVSQNLGHFCDEADEIEEIRSDECSLVDEMENNGFVYDDELTALGRDEGNIDYNTCIFTGKKKNKKCCDGWKGLNCDEAICMNECLNNGVCDSPNHCNCEGTNHCGPTCNFTADDYGSQAYCFTDGKCQRTKSPWDLMSPLECCYLRNGVSYKQCARDECLTCRDVQYSYPPVDSKFSGTTGASSTCSGSNGFTKTFDGLMFIYEACCSYVLLRNQLETVVMEMAGCESNAHGNIGLSVELGDNRKIFMNASEVRINGRQVEVQPGYAERALKITKNGIYHVLEYGRLKCGVSDDLWFVKYEVNEDKQVTGICGNKNNYPKDDFMDKKSMVEFMNHWKADPFQKCNETKEVTFDKTKDDELKKKIVEACIFLKSYPFSKCHDKVDVKLLFDKCLSEYCTKSVKNKTEVIEVTCRLGGQYAAECGRNGVLLEWRSEGFCYKPCSNPDMVYTELTSQCDPSCSNVMGIEPCPHEEKYPGCKCKPGLFQEGDKCYKPKDCPCVFDGILYEAGHVLKKDCNNCTCTFGSWACTKIGCPKTCSVFGLNQVITFDGFSYSHNGPSCEYILVQHSGSLNYEENFLRITVETETLGNSNSIFTKPRLVKMILRKLQKSTTVEVRLSSGSSWVTLDGVSISEERQPIKNDLVLVIITDWQIVVQGDNEQLKVEVFGGIDIRLGEAYMSQVSGLCGNWNNMADDELRSSSGIFESSTSFSMSFSDCDTKLFPRFAPFDPCMGQTDKTMTLQKLCKAFIDDDKCSRSKQSVDYEEICLKHQCAELLSPEDTPSDAAFDKQFLYYGIRKVMECINQGHIDIDYIVNDPDSTVLCPSGLMFHICGSPVKSCRQLSTYWRYENFHILGKTCFPGCLCSDGKLLDENEECVLESECPCYDDDSGKTYSDGDEIVKDCVTRQCKQGKWLDSPVPQTAVCGTGFIHYDMRQDCNTTCDNFDKCWSAKTICDGCICPEGKVMDENGKCILPEDCPCLHDNKHYKPGETVDTKSTHCTCIVRRWVCEDKDDYKPSCTLSGDVYVTRFDGVHETNPGLNSCAYVLVASDDSLLKLDDCVELSITAQNLPCGQSGIICNKVISVEYGSKKVLLARGKHPTVDGEEMKLDSGFHKSSFVTVTYNQVMTLLLFSNGLSILYDGATRVYINLPNCYKHYVDGLCGRFGDELKSDDLGGMSTWKDDPTCPESSSYKIPKCEDDAKLSWATATCSIITTGKLFEKCRMVVDYQTYHSNCIASTCSCEVGRDCECTCTAVSNFAKACASHNICVHWRSNELCPVMCPEGQHYEPCGDPVSQSCYGNLTSDQLSLNDEEMNVEGCYCSDGQLLNSKGTCVEKKSCDCVHEGITYASNATILVDCRNCFCREGKFQCEGESCQKCEDDEFQCEGPNMRAVCRNQLLQCDGNEDCIDGADEKNCSNICDKTSNFFCGPMNECLPPSFICDGQVDCLDAKDEANCNKCRADTTECHLSGMCIPAQFKCDGSLDCIVFDKDDRSDEEGCSKETTSTALPTTDSAIYPTLLPKLVPKNTTGSSTEAPRVTPYLVPPTGPPTVFPTAPSVAPRSTPPTVLTRVPPTAPYRTATPTGVPPTAPYRTASLTATPTGLPPTAPYRTAPPTATSFIAPYRTASPTATPTGLPPTAPYRTAPPTATSSIAPYRTASPTATPPGLPPTAPYRTAPPTASPTGVPPTAPPTAFPTGVPPTAFPTASPTGLPPTAPYRTAPPTASSTGVPPTAPPTASPTGLPPTAPYRTAPPPASPTGVPPTAPYRTALPTATPTGVPPTAPYRTALPTASPTGLPPTAPYRTAPPTASPTGLPPTAPYRTALSTATPSIAPYRTASPTATTSGLPTTAPYRTAPPTATPTGLPPTAPYRTALPTATPAGLPPTAPYRTAPPTATPTGLPPFSPTVLPTVSTVVPHTAPPTVLTTDPLIAPYRTVLSTATPTGLPLSKFPPGAPSTGLPPAPPTIYPTVPPTAPSTVSRTAPPKALPTTSLKSELTTYKKEGSTTDDRLKHCKPFKLLENGRVKFSKLSGNSRTLRRQRLIFTLTEIHYAVLFTLVFSDATEVSMSTSNRTHKGTFLHLSRKFQGNGLMHYSAYPMYLVDALSINFTSNLGFDGLLKVEMSGCHPGILQTTVRPYKNTEKQTVTLGPYKPTSPKSETCEPFDLMKNSSLLTVNYTKGTGIKSAEILRFQFNGDFHVDSISLELHEADMIFIQITDAAGKIIPIKFLKERHAKQPKTNILSAFINSRVDYILLELRPKEGDWKTKVIKILGCPLPQKTDIPLPSTKVYRPSFPGTSRSTVSTGAPKISIPSQLYSTGPNIARSSTYVIEPKTSEKSHPVSTAWITANLISPETLYPRKVQTDTTYETPPSSEYKTTQQASTESISTITPEEFIIEKLKPPCKPQRLIKNGRAKFGKLSAAAQKLRNQTVNLLLTETHFIVNVIIEFLNASGISVSSTNETHKGTFLNLTEYVDDDGVIHLTGYPMFPVDYISINFTSDAGFESLTRMEVSGCQHEKQQTTLKPQEPTAPGVSRQAEVYPSTAKPIRPATLPSISTAPCQPFDLMEEPDENFESMNFSIKNKYPLTIEYELKLIGTFIINFIYLEITQAESVSVLFSNATHSNVPLPLVTNEDFGPNKYFLISKPASRVDNLKLKLTLKSEDWKIKVVQVIGCPQVNKTTTPPVTTPGPEFPGATSSSSEKGTSTRQPSEELKKCQISTFIVWDVCYVEKDSIAGISRKDEECRTGDMVDSGVSVSFDCLHCLCTDGSFNCQEKIGEFRESFDSCAILNCTVEGDAVVQNPDPCSCPGEAPKPLSPPKCECTCPAKGTPATPRSTTGQTPTSSTTETSDVCPTSVPPKQTPCSLVTENYTFAETVPEVCLRGKTIPLKACAGACQTFFKVAYNNPGLATLETQSCSCCQAIELVNRQVTVSCPGSDVNILVTEAESCNCSLSGCYIE